MDIPVGTRHTESVTVDRTNLASAVGSGLVDVFSTPMMVALMEKAASGCISPYLEDGYASVGTQLNINHSSATPEGLTVKATATVTLVDRRRVEFTVTAEDDAGEIGSGTHTRFVVDRKKFQSQADGKLQALR